jgi:tetratricopeptide (TPR) repeat protein
MKLNACVVTRHLHAVGAACVSLLLAWPAQAENMKNDTRIPTIAEMRLLPPYCPDTQIISRVYGRQQAPSKYDDHTKPYVDLYGADFWHLHHYCFGLVDVVRSYRIFDRKERDGKLKKSISEFSYVLRGVSPNSILRPELHVKRAQSLILLGRGGEAVADFKQAMALKRDYAPAYASLSDYYKEAGKKDLALTTLEEGLTQSPGDRTLLRRYSSLGGKKTFALPAAAEPVAEPSPAAQQAATQDAPTTPVQEPDKALPAREEQTPPVPAIGNSTNPYCRFCP